MNRNLFNGPMCVYVITITLLFFCGLTAYLSLLVLAPSMNMSQDQVFVFDENFGTLDITAATRGNLYHIQCLHNSTLGRPIETSISEDPQPHPQSLRFFEVDDRNFRNFEVF